MTRPITTRQKMEPAAGKGIGTFYASTELAFEIQEEKRSI